MSAIQLEIDLAEALEDIQLGPGKPLVPEILSKSLLKKLALRFSSESPSVLAIGIREILRFICMAANADQNFFFPGDQFLDEIWHELIVETKFYRELCEKFRSGSFVDHTAMPLTEYLDSITADQAKREQLAWLILYVDLFGPIDQPAFAILPMARGLANLMGLGLEDLNSLASTFSKINKSADTPALSLEEFADSYLAPYANELNVSATAVKAAIKEYFKYSHAHRSDRGNVLSFAELELLHSYSVAFAFTLAQHLAAFDRLSNEINWQNKNPSQWNSIRQGDLLCGSATTHLAKPGPSNLVGIKENHFYLVNGNIPWCTGFTIFDVLVIGFDNKDELIFALCDFPTKLQSDSFLVTPHGLAVVNGTSSAKIQVTNLLIKQNQIISSRLKTSTPPAPRGSNQFGCEIGISASALLAVTKITSTSTHPRNPVVIDTLRELQREYFEIRKNRDEDSSNPETLAAISSLNRRSVHLLTLAGGASSLMSGSLVSRLSQEAMLFDVVVQSPKTIEEKLKSVITK